MIELKYGRRLRDAYAREGGELLRRRIDEMPNEQYQALFGASRGASCARPCSTALAAASAPASSGCSTTTAGERRAARARPRRARPRRHPRRAPPRARETTDRPTVIFAYTIKGYGLEIAGRPQNHSALLDGEQIDGFRDASSG